MGAAVLPLRTFLYFFLPLLSNSITLSLLIAFFPSLEPNCLCFLPFYSILHTSYATALTAYLYPAARVLENESYS